MTNLTTKSIWIIEQYMTMNTHVKTMHSAYKTRHGAEDTVRDLNKEGVAQYYRLRRVDFYDR